MEEEACSCRCFGRMELELTSEPRGAHCLSSSHYSLSMLLAPEPAVESVGMVEFEVEEEVL